MALVDVSRAHFYADSVRDVYVKLPDEDPRSSEPGVCGRLVKTMYGTWMRLNVGQPITLKCWSQPDSLWARPRRVTFMTRLVTLGCLYTATTSSVLATRVQPKSSGNILNLGSKSTPNCSERRG